MNTQSNEKEYFTSLLKEQLQCPVCFQNYDLLTRLPFMVCANQHSLCQKCFSNYTKDSQSRPCVLCKEKIFPKQLVNKNRLICCMLQSKLKIDRKVFIDCAQYKYVGETDKEGKKHGPGEKLTSSGLLLKGNFKEGSLDGPCSVENLQGDIFTGQCEQEVYKGLFTTKDGQKVKGKFLISENMISGEENEKKYKNGTIFVGPTNNLKAQGHGKLFFQCGNRYEGEFREDKIKKNSQGTIHGSFKVKIGQNSISGIEEIDELIEKNKQSSSVGGPFDFLNRQRWHDSRFNQANPHNFIYPGRQSSVNNFISSQADRVIQRAHLNSNTLPSSLRNERALSIFFNRRRSPSPSPRLPSAAPISISVADSLVEHQARQRSRSRSRPRRARPTYVVGVNERSSSSQSSNSQSSSSQNSSDNSGQNSSLQRNRRKLVRKRRQYRRRREQRKREREAN